MVTGTSLAIAAVTTFSAPVMLVRTASADDYAAGQRLYGNVDGELLWTFDGQGAARAALGIERRWASSVPERPVVRPTTG